MARIEVDKGYVAGDVGLIETLLKSYTWEPSVVKLKDSCKSLYFVVTYC